MNHITHLVYVTGRQAGLTEQRPDWLDAFVEERGTQQLKASSGEGKITTQKGFFNFLRNAKVLFCFFIGARQLKSEQVSHAKNCFKIKAEILHLCAEWFRLDSSHLLIVTLTYFTKKASDSLKGNNIRRWATTVCLEHRGLTAHLETVHSKSTPSCRESTKQLADPREDRECFTMSALFISFSNARGLPLTSCLKLLQCKHKQKYRFSCFSHLSSWM